MKKVVMMFVLLLVCSSLLVTAQKVEEYTLISGNLTELSIQGITEPAPCTFFCKVGKVFFGSREARVGKATWWDVFLGRTEPVVGAAAGTWINCGDLLCTCGSPQCTDTYGRTYNQGQRVDKNFVPSPAAPTPEAPAPTQQPTTEQQAPAPAPATQPAAQKPKAPPKTPTPESVPTPEKQVLPGTQRSFTDADFKDKNLVTILKSQEGVTGTFNKKEGAFTLNKEGTKLFFQETGKQKVEVQTADLPQTRFGGIPAPYVDPAAQHELQSVLGSNYKQFVSTLENNKEFWKTTDEDSGKELLVMRGSRGVVRVEKDLDTGLYSGYRILPSKKGEAYATEYFVAKNGQVLATQTKEGEIKVGKNTYRVDKEVKVENIASKNGIQTIGAEDEEGGNIRLVGDELQVTDYEEEIQFIVNTKTKEIQELEGDYYTDGESGCKEDQGCFVPTGGTVFEKDKNGRDVPKHLVSYDYTGTGAVRGEKLEEIEYFNPVSGRKEGSGKGDGTKIIAQRDAKGKYNGEYEVTRADGRSVTVKREGDSWFSTGKEVAAAEEGVTKAQEALNKVRAEGNIGNEMEKKAEAERDAAQKELEEAQSAATEVDRGATAGNLKDDLDSIESSSQGSLARAQTVLESIYAISSSIKSYPAISQLLFGDTEFYKDWRTTADKLFAPLLGSTWFPSALCENVGNRWQDIEPQGKAVIKTVSGTYQAVASIQMERSEQASPIICHKNPDESADQQYICEVRQVCVDDTFCYADEDRDKEADDEDEPLKGYFYKVTWAVSSPQDEAYTPLVDENGVAVSFNIFLDTTVDGMVSAGAVPMYDLGGNIVSPIQLQNGASDRDAIIKYSTKLYQEACIHWNQAPRSITSFAKEEETGPFGGTIGDVCYGANDPGFISSIGQVNWERSGQDAASVTVSHGEISRNTDW